MSTVSEYIDPRLVNIHAGEAIPRFYLISFPRTAFFLYNRQKISYACMYLHLFDILHQDFNRITRDRI